MLKQFYELVDWWNAKWARSHTKWTLKKMQ